MPPNQPGPDRGPLAGLLVADFSRILAGPYATMLLADLGAEVIKVEGPGGDDTCSWQPPVRDGGATYYLGVNRNKRSIALALREEADLAAGRELGARGAATPRSRCPCARRPPGQRAASGRGGPTCSSRTSGPAG